LSFGLISSEEHIYLLPSILGPLYTYRKTEIVRKILKVADKLLGRQAVRAAGNIGKNALQLVEIGI